MSWNLCGATETATKPTALLVTLRFVFALHTENVTAQTRVDAQGNWHNPAHDVLRCSIAMDRLRFLAVAEPESGGMSHRQKELLLSMPVTRKLLRLRDAEECGAVQVADEDPSRSLKFFSTTAAKTIWNLSGFGAGITRVDV